MHHLKRTLPSNLDAVAEFGEVEFVLLDYDSPDGLNDWVHEEMISHLDSERLRFFRLEDAPLFRMNHAKNIAHLLGDGEVLCNLDADNYISPQFVAELLRLHANDVGILTHGRKSSWGRISLRRTDFLSLGGYEETLTGWGQADLDLIARAKRELRLNSVSLSQFDRYINHSDEERTRYYDNKDKRATRQSNIKRLKRLRSNGIGIANVDRDWGVASIVGSASETVRQTGVFVSKGELTGEQVACFKPPQVVAAALEETIADASVECAEEESAVGESLDFTTVVAVDDEHLKELEIAWPTWRLCRPEILARPLLFICDDRRTDAEWSEKLSFVDHQDKRIRVWRSDAPTQRERMLSGLVFGTAQWVKTPWYLKLDTDVVAKTHDNWIKSKWFEADSNGRAPVFVASPWGYTKPADAIDRLDEWANGKDAFKGTEPLNLIRSDEADRVRHDRITSWCFFGNTEWTKRIAKCASGKLPVPSQDTFLWYCAERLGSRYKKVRMGKLGWNHCGSLRKMRVVRDSAIVEIATKNLSKTQRVNSVGASNSKGSHAGNARPLTRGVVYLLTGVSHAVRLVVSLWSLRRFYSGPITLLTTQKESHAIGSRCAADARLGIDHRVIRAPKLKRNHSFLTKASYCLDAPYQANVHLDCDTLVTGDIEPLFDVGPEQPLIVTQFSDWSTAKPVIRKRIEAWRELSQDKMSQERYTEIIEKSLESQPAINTGVFGYYHRAPILPRWKEWTWVGRKTFICDEIALQILLPQFAHRTLDCRFNCSPVYRSNQEDVRVWHFHGKKHLRKELARQLWLPAYEEVCALNLAGILEWTPSKDQRLARFLKSNRVRQATPSIESLDAQ